ncbi:hypothetical protein HZ326_4105 [Fusarium oxysporum f. sp. albedinis]|nr:hypothetical protein HZ326_4105 [Fusarium oxysporum f. sp. albedinis]
MRWIGLFSLALGLPPFLKQASFQTLISSARIPCLTRFFDKGVQTLHQRFFSRRPVIWHRSTGLNLNPKS